MLLECLPMRLDEPQRQLVGAAINRDLVVIQRNQASVVIGDVATFNRQFQHAEVGAVCTGLPSRLSSYPSIPLPSPATA